jgi:hypothetical protein
MPGTNSCKKLSLVWDMTWGTMIRIVSIAKGNLYWMTKVPWQLTAVTIDGLHLHYLPLSVVSIVLYKAAKMVQTDHARLAWNQKLSGY